MNGQSGSGSQGAIGALLQLALAGVDAWHRKASGGTTERLLLCAIAGLGGLAALFCLSAAAYVMLVQRISQAEAWAVLGLAYGVGGGFFYLMATRRR
jgi:hypothetical protein